VTRRIEDIAGNLELQLQRKVANISLALDESCDVRDTDQLLVFSRGITKDLKIVEELAELGSMKGTTTGGRSVHGGYCMHGRAGTEMVPTGRCHNRWLSKSYG